MPPQGAAAKCLAWGRLLRLPNLLTVPGDGLAGFLLAAAALHPDLGDLPRAAWAGLSAAVAAGLLFYVAGLIQNDLADLKEDRRDRPQRPLPSGAVGTRAAAAALAAALLAALVAAALASPAALGVGTALAAAITTYNLRAKRHGFWGPLNMGSCRGLNLLLGAAALGSHALAQPAVLLSAAGLTLYVAAVTRIARRETQTQRLGWARLAPLAILVVWLPLATAPALASSEPLPLRLAAPHLGLLALLYAALVLLPLAGKIEPARTQQAVGKLIRNLIFIQAALAASALPTGLPLAGLLLALFPLQAALAWRFYSS